MKIAMTRIAVTTRGISYVFLLLQWTWLILLYSSWAIESGVLQSYLNATQMSDSREPLDIKLPEFIRQPFAVIVLILMMILSFVLFLRAPKQATDITIRATKLTAKSITPTVQKLVHTPKARKKRLAESVLVGCIVMLSVLACMFTIPVIYHVSLPATNSWVVNITLSTVTISLSLLSLLFSYLSAKNTRRHSRDV